MFLGSLASKCFGVQVPQWSGVSSIMTVSHVGGANLHPRSRGPPYLAGPVAYWMEGQRIAFLVGAPLVAARP